MSAPNRTRGAIIGLALAGALGASLVGGAAASAASTTGGGMPALFDQSRGPQLKDILAGLVTKGTITQAQADAITAAVQAAKPAPPARPGGAPPAGRPAPGFALGRPFQPHQAALTYLGITQQQLMDQLKTGESLGEVAAATPGKTRDGLIAALTAAESTRIDKAVTDGKLTAADAAAAKAKVAERITLMVDAKMGPRPAPPTKP